EPRAANENFNVMNGDVQSWQTLWPLLAKKFGVKLKTDQFGGEHRMKSEAWMHETPPISLYEAEQGLKGKAGPGKIQQTVDLVQWSKQEKVKNALAKLAEREGLDKDVLDKATWAFLSMVLGRDYDIILSMSKA